MCGLTFIISGDFKHNLNEILKSANDPHSKSIFYHHQFDIIPKLCTENQYVRILCSYVILNTEGVSKNLEKEFSEMVCKKSLKIITYSLMC